MSFFSCVGLLGEVSGVGCLRRCVRVAETVHVPYAGFWFSNLGESGFLEEVSVVTLVL